MNYEEAIEKAHAHLDELEWLIADYPELRTKLKDRARDIFEPGWDKDPVESFDQLDETVGDYIKKATQ